MRAASTGHPGSITTIHADDPSGALGQLGLLMMQANPSLTRADAESFVRRAVDVWIQLHRVDGRRGVSEILFYPRSTPIFGEVRVKSRASSARSRNR